MPIRQHLSVTVAAAVELPEAAAGRPRQAMCIRPLAGREESTFLRREDGFGLDVSDVHSLMIAEPRRCGIDALCRLTRATTLDNILSISCTRNGVATNYLN